MREQAKIFVPFVCVCELSNRTYIYHRCACTHHGKGICHVSKAVVNFNVGLVHRDNVRLQMSNS